MMVVDTPTPLGAGDAPADTPQAADPGAWTSARVSKTLWPPQAGTKRLCARYGDALVCVRYRHDARTQQRYTTVELVVDRGPLKTHRQGTPAWMLDASSAAGLTTLALAKAGAVWDGTRQVWRLRLAAARALGVEHLVRRRPRPARVAD